MIGDNDIVDSTGDNTNSCTNINTCTINVAAVCTQLGTWQNAQQKNTKRPTVQLKCLRVKIFKDEKFCFRFKFCD